MKHILSILAAALTALFGLVACSNEDYPEYSPCKVCSPADPASAHPDDPLWVRHHDSALKILAIGNSFTINACHYLPMLIDELDGDSICIARLTRSGCSLSQHWESHISGTPDYDLYYSDGGQWVKSETKVFDDALCLLDWDIIITQQASYLSGIWSSYLPYIDYLQRLFRELHPGVKLGWHYTWAYRPGTQHDGFANYDRDSEKMHNAIIEAGDLASEGMEYKIHSATLIHDMRKAYPEVENQFSEDGYHISDPTALLALTMLWHDTLIEPTNGVSSIADPVYPADVNPESFLRALDILRKMHSPGGSSVPMLFE